MLCTAHTTAIQNKNKNKSPHIIIIMVYAKSRHIQTNTGTGVHCFKCFNRFTGVSKMNITPKAIKNNCRHLCKLPIAMKSETLSLNPNTITCCTIKPPFIHPSKPHASSSVLTITSCDFRQVVGSLICVRGSACMLAIFTCYLT